MSDLRLLPGVPQHQRRILKGAGDFRPAAPRQPDFESLTGDYIGAIRFRRLLEAGGECEGAIDASLDEVQLIAKSVRAVLNLTGRENRFEVGPRAGNQGGGLFPVQFEGRG